jgi:hypothetical protein
VQARKTGLVEPKGRRVERRLATAMYAKLNLKVSVDWLCMHGQPIRSSLTLPRKW